MNARRIPVLEDWLGALFLLAPLGAGLALCMAGLAGLRGLDSGLPLDNREMIFWSAVSVAFWGSHVSGRQSPHSR